MSGVIDVSKVPSQTLRIIGSGGLQLPQGDDNTRPIVPTNNGQKHGFDGTIRWNTDSNSLEYCSNGLWIEILDKPTAAATYVTMINATFKGDVDMGGFRIKNLKLSSTYENADAIPFKFLSDNYLPLDGSSAMRGFLRMGGMPIKNLRDPDLNDPTSGKDAVTVDFALNTFAKPNAPYTAALNMNGNRIYNLVFNGDSTSEDDAISKRYGDTRWLIKNNIQDTGVSGDSMIGPLTIRGNKTPAGDVFLGGVPVVQFANLIGDIQASIGLTSDKKNMHITVNGNDSGKIINMEAASLVLPSGLTSERPADKTNGSIRFNTTTNAFEVVFDSANWVNLTTAKDLVAATTQLNSDIRAYIEEAISKIRSIPVGVIFMCPADIPFDGTVLLNGAAYSRTDKADLFNYAVAKGLVATSEDSKTPGQFGPGNGTNTFTVPDWRGLFPRANDNGKGIDLNRSLGSLQLDAMQNITGTFVGDVGDRGNNSTSGAFTSVDRANGDAGSSAYGEVKTFTFDASRVVRTANETRSINVSTNFCIQY